MDEQNWMEKIGVLNKLSNIEITLARLEGDLRAHREAVKTHDDILDKRMTTYGHTLYGENGQPGLVTITDRLKARLDIWGWNFAVIWAAIVSIGAEIVITRFIRHG